MRDLELASQVPPKTRDIGAKRFFNASLTLSKAFTVACFIVYGKHMPVEKLRDASHRLILTHSGSILLVQGAVGHDLGSEP